MQTLTSANGNTYARVLPLPVGAFTYKSRSGKRKLRRDLARWPKSIGRTVHWTVKDHIKDRFKMRHCICQIPENKEVIPCLANLFCIRSLR